MSYLLKEVPINCPQCGFNLFRVFKHTYNVTTKLTEEEERTPICRKCVGNLNWLMVLKQANRIETLQMQEDASFKTTKDYGQKIQEHVNRKAPEEQELELTPDQFQKLEVNEGDKTETEILNELGLDNSRE